MLESVAEAERVAWIGPVGAFGRLA
jgi:hypothetical protein